ncbi:MAG TPA: hypothetical protein VK789_23060 [Bryobacteraceae bacterium]|nr:hypothetical protein [Bryobacteraceae bacterium]
MSAAIAGNLREIVGYASTCEAFHWVRMEECGEEPAREAGMDPDQIGNINYHGAATRLNDRIETRARLFSEEFDRSPAMGIGSRRCSRHFARAEGWGRAADGKPGGLDPEGDLDYIPNRARCVDWEYALANYIAFGSVYSALVLRKN